eukprot:CAMPEP_0202859722 /NCGR_PEP_ID=MMETSP1391-20130828/1713_1 /ASSEMBLY_ACC=CAM_ASM_000867 /TAXON_ID=1034604 /ORGANISM="Chlamydomonas leiostraca, Strain SAG 11-49" /LENGTH=79 /DNA_ID=CAMNT_0049538781 /DNA_START=280 /DNA_END=519 /DNA_ORIENTATION=+
MNDIRDAVESCSCARTVEERDQCYECFGLDGRKVAAYYYPVEAMETGLEAATHQGDETGQRLVGFGSFMFSLLLVSKIA